MPAGLQAVLPAKSAVALAHLVALAPDAIDDLIVGGLLALCLQNLVEGDLLVQVHELCALGAHAALPVQAHFNDPHLGHTCCTRKAHVAPARLALDGAHGAVGATLAQQGNAHGLHAQVPVGPHHVDLPRGPLAPGLRSRGAFGLLAVSPTVKQPGGRVDRVWKGQGPKGPEGACDQGPGGCPRPGPRHELCHEPSACLGSSAIVASVNAVG